MDALADLTPQTLRALAGSLRSGPLVDGITNSALAALVGTQSSDIAASLRRLVEAGFRPGQVALVLELLADAKRSAIGPTDLLELVITGPEVSGVPTADTAATMRTLIEGAEREILLVGYAVHNASAIFEPLANRMAAHGGLQVTMCLDISRRPGDTSLESEIVRRFAAEFASKHWPWSHRPTLYHDRRSLATSLESRSSLHAKCVVSDRSSALITSANFTDAAQHRNIEVGVLVRHAPFVARLTSYFDQLIAKGVLVECTI